MQYDMRRVFEKHRNESPDKVLTEMQLYFLSCAESFRNGEITEEDFFIKTYVRTDLLEMVIELYDETTINYYYNVTVNDMRDFVAAWKKWKETGKIAYEKWMVRVINTKGNIMEATRWVFFVIDALLYPINRFLPLDRKLYRVPVQNSYYGNTISLLVDDYLVMDSVKRFDEAFTVGNSYHLKYRSGIEADITIDSFADNEYKGIGIIYGFMTEKQRISICEINGRIRILFNMRRFSDYQIALGTFFEPIPHPDWDQFNLADLEWSYQREAEYKTLRLPYMLGMMTEDKILKNKFRFNTSSNKKGNIINLADITQND